MPDRVLPPVTVRVVGLAPGHKIWSVVRVPPLTEGPTFIVTELVLVAQIFPREDKVVSLL